MRLRVVRSASGALVLRMLLALQWLTNELANAVTLRARLPARASTGRGFLSACAGREGCAISRCRRKLPKLPRLLRRKDLRGRAKSRRHGKFPAPARARRELWSAS